MSDEPPSYDDSKSTFTPNEKNSASSQSAAATSIAASSKSPALLHTYDISSIFGAFRSKREPARAAIIEDVRLIVQPNTGTIAQRLTLFEDCAALSRRHGISFPVLLQDTSLFHAHTALYWAIVNSLGASTALVALILAHSHPLNPATIKDIRRACISARSQEMFQFLRMRPEVGALSAENRFILNLEVPPEELHVETMDSPQQAFSVNFRIPMFRKRMMLSKTVEMEFIARDRLWRLLFCTPGSDSTLVPKTPQEWFESHQWGAHLKLCENSPSTHLEFGLVLLDQRKNTAQPAHAWNHFEPTAAFRNEDDRRSPSTVAGWMWPTFGSYKGAQA
ncbi:hypothetical protein C8R47DRAFT_1216980 [Mycena vitilis]|nr:hypothetical protein C8R47DRAFT_1216980 [Mycena vitilis]